MAIHTASPSPPPTCPPPPNCHPMRHKQLHPRIYSHPMAAPNPPHLQQRKLGAEARQLRLGRPRVPQLGLCCRQAAG